MEGTGTTETTRFDHVGLSVADLDACAAFFATAFGFEVEFAFTLDPHPIRGVMLRQPSGCRLQVFEHAGSAPGLSADSPIEALGTRGYGHCALTAADIEPAFSAALAAGATAVREPG